MTNTQKNNNGCLYKPAPDTIKFRVRYYAETRFHRPLCRLSPEQRMTVVYCLHEKFQFSNGEIATLLSCSNTTVWRDLQTASLFKNKSEFMSHVKDIEDYILYIVKYIH